MCFLETAGLNLHFHCCENKGSVQCLHWSQQQSAGLLHINGFESIRLNANTKKDTTRWVVSFLVETNGLEPSTSCV